MVAGRTGQRVRNEALLVLGLVVGKAVHLGHIVRAWPVASKDPSLVNRLRRFLDNAQVDSRTGYRPVVAPILQQLAGQPSRLVLDVPPVGLNHRMTMVGVQYRGRTLPLIWEVFEGTKGHVGFQTHIRLLRRLKDWLPADSPVEVVADAGYESLSFLRWLSRQHWQFVIRLTGRTLVSTDGEHWTKLRHLSLEPGQTRVLGWVRVTAKHNCGWLYLVAHWAQGEDEVWYLVSNRQMPPAQWLRLYARRMWIEEMFGDMKGHGFNLQASHLEDAQRMNRLLLGLCIAYLWLFSIGSWVVKNGFRHWIDVKSRRDKSYFRLGLDWLARALRLDFSPPDRFVPYYLSK